MQRSKCTVLTYFDTPILEALVIGVPTIVIIDLNRWHFRPDCQGVIDLLLESKIIHSTTKSATHHIAACSDTSMKNWWEDDQTLNARNAFLNRFARQGEWLSDWRTFVEALGTSSANGTGFQAGN
jgi:putative transferase (TIGR04331 family)